MHRLAHDVNAFLDAKREHDEDARQNAAFFLVSGIDLPKALAAGAEEKRRIILRIERMIERERLKGMHRHWSYDLNRHIALKQALERLKSDTSEPHDAADARPYVQAGSARTTKTAPAAPSSHRFREESRTRK